jgi:hypothetical protein
MTADSNWGRNDTAAFDPPVTVLRKAPGLTTIAEVPGRIACVDGHHGAKNSSWTAPVETPQEDTKEPTPSTNGPDEKKYKPD